LLRLIRGARGAPASLAAADALLSPTERQQQPPQAAPQPAGRGTARDEFGAESVGTFGCANRVDATAMGEPSRDGWAFPGPATTTADIQRAAERFAEERARLVAWAKEMETERAANAVSRSSAAAAKGVGYDSIWIETCLAKLKLAGPQRSTDGAGVFRGLGVTYLLHRAIDTLVPATARAVLFSLLHELRETSLVPHVIRGETVTVPTADVTGAAVDDLAPVDRPAYHGPSPFDIPPSVVCPESGGADPAAVVKARVDAWADVWAERRVACESLHLERLRRARDANAATRLLQSRTAEYERDVELIERQRDFEEAAKLRMVIKGWRGFVGQQNLKRRVASGVINSLADRANAELCRSVLLNLRAAVAFRHERKRRQAQFDEATAHELREAKLIEQLTLSKTALTRAVADAQEAADSAAEQHWREMCEIKSGHEDQDKLAKRTHAENEAIRRDIAELKAENKRWAVIANRALLELTSAVERRTGHERRHPEVDLLYVAPKSQSGEAPVPATPFQTLFDVLDSQAPSQRLLLLFANFCIRSCRSALPTEIGDAKVMENFSKDATDGIGAACAVALLYPTLLAKEDIGALSVVNRADRVVKALQTVGLVDIVSATDIMLGVSLRNLTLFSVLFRLYAMTHRFGTADHDLAQLEARELIVPGLRRRRDRRMSGAGSTTSGRSFLSRGGVDEDSRTAGGRSGLAISSSGMSAEQQLLARHAVVKFSDFDTVTWYFEGEEPCPDGATLENGGDSAPASPKSAAGSSADLNGSRSMIADDDDDADNDDDNGSLHDEGLARKQSAAALKKRPPRKGGESPAQQGVVSVATPKLRCQVNVDIADVEKRFGLSVERQRAWGYLAELTQRDLILKLHATRNVLTGEVLDERGRRFMEWFLDVDEDRLWRLAQLNPHNARNEVDKVQVVVHNNYWALRAVYQAYASVDAGQRLSQEGMLALLKDTQIVKGLGRNFMDEALRFCVEDLDTAGENDSAATPLGGSTVTPSAMRSRTASVLGGSASPGKDVAGGTGGGRKKEAARSDKEDEFGRIIVAFVPSANEKLRRRLLSPMVNFQISPQHFIMILCVIAHHRYKNSVDDEAEKQHAAIVEQMKLQDQQDGAGPASSPAAEPLAVHVDGEEAAPGASVAVGNQQLLPLHKCLRKLLSEDVVGVANSSTIDLLRSQSRHPHVQRAHKRFSRSLGRAFKNYASAGGTAATEVQTTAAAIAAAKGKLQGAKFMTPDDTIKFCRDARMVDGRFSPAQAFDLASALACDDARLMSVCDESRIRAINAQQTGGGVAAESFDSPDKGTPGSPAPTASAAKRSAGGGAAVAGGTSTPTVPFEIEAGQPEDRKGQGMAQEDFVDFLTAAALVKLGHPLEHTCNSVARFYRDSLGPALKELHL
jgi:hypothetical protein